MTTPRYATTGCAAGSQEHGEASNFWIVNFNNGNVNNNHRNNNAFARAVRGGGAPASECQGAGKVTFREMHTAWKRARRHKVPSRNQLRFEANWAERLFELQDQINAGTWRPLPATCFIATRPKAREIHAPDFSDRVVHHWVVPKLEQHYEPKFIFDSYANRRGKGAHAAVDRARDHIRAVHSGQGGGYYLKLDIHNFFNSINREKLYAMLKREMVRSHMPLTVQRVVHALLAKSIAHQGVRNLFTAEERALVPYHKRLEASAAGYGIPIGNLPSQFFSNVYLNEFDQFVKHVLKGERYVRYVDDFVLFHRDLAQLELWLKQIEAFLAERLDLRLKDDIQLQPVSCGLDFLGYVIFPTHTRVRTRVVRHARAALNDWSQGRVGRDQIRATPQDIQRLASTWASYLGHFRHANSHRLQADFARRFPAQVALASRNLKFDYRLQSTVIAIPHSEFQA